MAMPPRLWESRIGRAGVIAVALGLIALALWVYAIGWRPSTLDYLVQGIDIDEHQGEIHWPTIAADGVDFVYLRATMAADGRDTQFPASWAGLRENGIRRGALHVWSFCYPAADQANNFNTVVPRAADALPAAVAIDFDSACPARPDRAAVIADLKRFVTMVEEHTGEPVLLKIAEPVEAVYDLSAAIPRPLWSSRNFLSPNYAARPWRMWQASNMRRIDGINGPVHWNVVAP